MPSHVINSDVKQKSICLNILLGHTGKKVQQGFKRYIYFYKGIFKCD
jgi:hypothetical protein